MNANSGGDSPIIAVLLRFADLVAFTTFSSMFTRLDSRSRSALRQPTVRATSCETSTCGVCVAAAGFDLARDLWAVVGGGP